MSVKSSARIGERFKLKKLFVLQKEDSMTLHSISCTCQCHKGGRCGVSACCEFAGIKSPEHCDTEEEKEEARSMMRWRKDDLLLQPKRD